MSPPQLSASYPEENPQRLPKYCANANYILTLLLDAYKFNETSWNNIIFQMKVGSKCSLWAGAEEEKSQLPRQVLRELRSKKPLSGLQPVSLLWLSCRVTRVSSPWAGGERRCGLDAGVHAQPHQHDPGGGSGMGEGARSFLVGCGHHLHHPHLCPGAHCPAPAPVGIGAWPRFRAW